MTKPRAILWTAVSSQAQADDEKASLPAQEADLRALADQQGWQVVDVLTVPGHSRRYIDWHDLVRDSLNAEIDAFYRLQQHWERKDFDILAVRDADRFARTQALHAYVTERTLDMGAIIWSLSDGKVDEQNFRMFIAMSGYRAAGAIDQLQKYHEMAVNAKPDKGLPVHGVSHWSHRIIRDEMGRMVAFEIDESRRRLFDDLAELLLDGHEWVRIPEQLARLGHPPRRWNVYYKAVFNPVWWGHAARRFKGKYGLWVFDADAPLPNGVRVWRNVYPAVWTGETAERVKAELRRRKSITLGRHNIYKSRRFAGLVMCAECGRVMHSHRSGTYLAVTCSACRMPESGRLNTISEKRLMEFLTELLKTIQTAGDPEAVFGQNEIHNPQIALGRARTDLDKVRKQAQAVTRLYAENAGSALEGVYVAELKELQARAEAIEQTIRRYEGMVSVAAPRRDAMATLDVHDLWQMPSRQVNQTLHHVFGNWRLVVRDRTVVGYATATKQVKRRLA